MKTVIYDETQWKLVPIKPNKEMLAAGKASFRREPYLDMAYDAMLAAAPNPPADGQAQQDADTVDALPDAVEYYGTVEDINAAQPDPAMAGDEISDDEIIDIMSEFAMAHETEAGIARYTKFDIVDGVRALLKRVQPDSRDTTWANAAEWVRNNYQDHPNLTSLTEAMQQEPKT